MKDRSLTFVAWTAVIIVAVVALLFDGSFRASLLVLIGIVAAVYLIARTRYNV